ncbi:MFS transporter [Clostridium sp.]|uniref:MFS transporter n=1 Tax=Clostridium sp. TaxID=1506 RepID=UPI002FC94764
MEKLNYKKTFLLGFGFFAIAITWSVYNAFMPILLGKYIVSSALIGFIMTVDNYLALFIQPAVGIFSDRIDTKFGKRMPFLMVGMPLAIVFTFLISKHTSLATLILFLLLMNLSMSLFRSPVIALMPDLTHEKNRSKANSIINFMGGIGSLIAFFIGSILWGFSSSYPFYLASFLMLVSFVILFIFIKEKRDVLQYKTSEEKIHIFKGLSNGLKNKNTRLLLFAVCSWFIGYNGIETFFTRYGEKFLGVLPNVASMSFSFMSLSFLAFAIPAGIVGTKIGKKKAITLGISGLILVFLVLANLRSILFIRIAFLFAGFFWAMININSYPFVAEMAPAGYIGTYTGLYYLFSSIAAIISPPLLGAIMDTIGYKFMFYYGSVFFILAFFFINMVKSEKQNHVNTLNS